MKTYVTTGDHTVQFDDDGLFKSVTVKTVCGVRVTVHNETNHLRDAGTQFGIGPRGELFVQVG